MARCLISFGANIGNPLDTIRGAADLLRGRLVAGDAFYQLSRYFRTPPVGGPSGQPPFVNAVAALHTELTAIEVWQAIRDVENELGRQRDRRWEARRIDLDILLYDDQRVWTPHLKIPHPRMCMRRFILVPALDVAPTWIDPVSGRSIAQLAAALQAGPGNLVLITDDPERHAAWLPDIARHTMAEIIPLGIVPTPTTSRWLSLASLADVRRALRANATATPLPPTKLVMILTTPPAESNLAESNLAESNLAESNLAESNLAESNLAESNLVGELIDWETRHQSLAESLQLAESPPESTQQSELGLAIAGPRYLLSGDNRAWAIHEIVSALEAMDCPVEPLQLSTS